MYGNTDDWTDGQTLDQGFHSSSRLSLLPSLSPSYLLVHITDEARLNLCHPGNEATAAVSVSHRHHPTHPPAGRHVHRHALHRFLLLNLRPVNRRVLRLTLHPAVRRDECLKIQSCLTFRLQSMNHQINHQLQTKNRQLKVLTPTLLTHPILVTLKALIQWTRATMMQK